MNLDLEIANWNIERVSARSARRSSIIERLNHETADIWFLTETYKDVCPNEEFFSIFSEKPDRISSEGEKWVSIWSKWKVQSLNEFVSDSSRCAAALVPESPHGSLILYGLVLPWNTDPRVTKGLTFQVFDEAVSNLERDLKKISALHPDIPIILAGDFNQSLVSKHYYGSNAKRERLKQFFTSNHLLALTSGDDDPVFRDSYPNACIDHICISDGSGFKLSSTSRWPNAPTLKDGPSDHYQIKVRLTHEI